MRKTGLFLVLLLLALPVCAGGPQRYRVSFGAAALSVELAADESTRQLGLMHRDALGVDEGMLFVFPEPARWSFWMKNTRIHLSIAFLDKDRVVVNVAEMRPHDLSGTAAAGDAVYAVEANRGWFDRHGVRTGTRVVFEERLVRLLAAGSVR